MYTFTPLHTHITSHMATHKFVLHENIHTNEHLHIHEHKDTHACTDVHVHTQAHVHTYASPYTDVKVLLVILCCCLENHSGLGDVKPGYPTCS